MIFQIQNKDSLKVSLHGETSANYDGHCLRAFSYFPEEMPLIRLAEPTDKCFKITTEDGTYYVTEHDTIEYQGKVYSSLDFYTKFSKGD